MSLFQNQEKRPGTKELWWGARHGVLPCLRLVLFLATEKNVRDQHHKYRVKAWWYNFLSLYCYSGLLCNFHIPVQSKIEEAK